VSVDPTERQNERNSPAMLAHTSAADMAVSAGALVLTGGEVSDAVEILPCRSGVWPVPRDAVVGWERAFPAVDVLAELARAWAWLDANPKQRPTLRGVKRFVQSWLARSQDRAAARSAQHAQGGTMRRTAPHPLSKTEAAFVALAEFGIQRSSDDEP
jgi:hypothetical protein